jgi:hypothetical protein
VSASKFTINVREIEGLGQRLGTVTAERLAGVSTSVVNDAARQFMGEGIIGATEGINLDKIYVRSKMDLVASPVSSKPRAEVITRGDLTVMGRFDPDTVRAPGAMRRAGPIKGQRSAGVDVAIQRGKAIREPQWFLMKLKNGNGYGAFVRDDSISPSSTALREGKAGKRHVYGPSPHQLFRKQIDVQGDRWQRDLEESAVTRLRGEIERSVT